VSYARAVQRVKTWLEAIRVIPRIDKAQWDELDLVARWLVATRAAVLVMTFVSSAIAGLLAARVGKFDALTWTLVTVCSRARRCGATSGAPSRSRSRPASRSSSCAAAPR
jgi:hypothetical protein